MSRPEVARLVGEFVIERGGGVRFQDPVTPGIEVVVVVYVAYLAQRRFALEAHCWNLPGFGSDLLRSPR
eukprot:4938346-Lingulodinium_polyedra.AAC.1